MGVDIIIPSRSQPDQDQFLKHSLASIASQDTSLAGHIRVLLCLDQGASVPSLPHGLGFDLVVLHAFGSGQVAALNAGIAEIRAEFVAFLEDDDQWHPSFLRLALQTLKTAQKSPTDLVMVSSTQLERNPDGSVVRVNDYATPSGWLLSNATLKQIGSFDASYRFHLDSEWLGRAAESGVRRFHLVEATAPIADHHLSQVRPWLYRVRMQSNQTCQLVRHSLPLPLVQRLVHPQSGMSSIARDPKLLARSRQERQRLMERFSRVPW